MAIKTYLTTDGSTTLYDTELEVHYRSTHGAHTEVNHVFIEGSRILEHQDHELHVLEFGFGGATSFMELASALLEQPQGRTLHYHTVEKYPVDPELLTHLSGPVGQLVKDVLTQSREAQAPDVITLSHGPITLSLYLGQWEEALLPKDLKAHAIFHDPFGPAKNPEGWSTKVFTKEREHLHPKGRIATYGAASKTRKAMCEANLQIASLPGPGRKREITVAAHTQDVLLEDDRATLIPHTRYFPS